MKIYDCSNSVGRPPHRGGGGPVVNDVVRYLWEHAYEYGCEFTDDVSRADVIFTNDVYPKEVLRFDRPRVKRMDGVFWQHALLSRNEPLNAAARQANHVIFVSEYAHRCYMGELPSHSVVPHWVDPKVFVARQRQELRQFVAVATDWSRPEKRLDAVLGLAVNRGAHVVLVGRVDAVLPVNVHPVGYLSCPQVIAAVLAESDAMLNFSYRDASPKVVAQATASGLPILFADSGGTSELVGSGVAVPDPCYSPVEDSVPRLFPEEEYQQFVDEYDDFATYAMYATGVHRFKQMLDGYFAVFCAVSARGA